MKKFSLIFLLFMSIFCATLPMEAAFADGLGAVADATADNSKGGDMQIVLCNAMKFVTGGIGKTIASFIIIGVGITFFTGKASWGLMIGVALGVSAMFGAPAIINAVTGGNDYFCKD